MALPVTWIQPYMPPTPSGSGVAGSKAFFVHSGDAGTHAGRFSIVDPYAPSQKIRAFQITPPGGYVAHRCHGGVNHAGGVLVAFKGNSSASGRGTWLAKLWPDGSVDSYPGPDPSVGGSAWVVDAGANLWVFFRSSAAPRLVDSSSLVWSTTSITATAAYAEPVVLGDFVYVWASASTLVRYSTSAPYTKTTVTTSGNVRSLAQVATDGVTAYWGSLTANSAETVTAGVWARVTAPISLESALCFDQDGYLRTTSFFGSTQSGWHPGTNAYWVEATGAPSGYSCYRMHLVGDFVIAGVGTP